MRNKLRLNVFVFITIAVAAVALVDLASPWEPVLIPQEDTIPATIVTRPAILTKGKTYRVGEKMGTGVTRAQETQPPELIPIPGKPWTYIIPDPDKYGWRDSANRPGYRFRGMNAEQQRFYIFIRNKRDKGVPLSFAEEATVRAFVWARCWPDPPVPNVFWAEYMRVLRNLDTAELNVAHRLMLSELVGRGFVASDAPMDEQTQRVVEYLNAPHFCPRNWFEVMFGRTEPLMKIVYAGYGIDLQEPSPTGSSFVFPNPPQMGMQMLYKLTGADLVRINQIPGDDSSRGHVGVLRDKKLTLKVTFRAVGDAGADFEARLGVQEAKGSIGPGTGQSGSRLVELTVPVSEDAGVEGFKIRMRGRGEYQAYWVQVTCTLTRSKEAIEKAFGRSQDDAKWRQNVDQVLRQLGYEDTPEGKRIKEMRQALAGDAAAWKNYVDRNLAALGYQEGPEARDYAELTNALKAGGAAWDQYVKSHGGGDDATKGSTALPPSLGFY